jgi:predicted transcriptional regulator
MNSTDNMGMPSQKSMTFQIDPQIRPVLDKQAEIQDRSVSWLINHYLRQALEANGLLPKGDKKSGKRD